MKINSMIFILFFLGFGSIAWGYSIDNFNTEIKIYPDGTAYISNLLILDSGNFSESEILYLPVIEPTKIIAADREYELKYAVLDNFIMVKPRQYLKDYEIKVQYFTNALSFKNKDIWTINYSVPSIKSMNLDEIKQNAIIVCLPQKSTLIAVPRNGLIYVDSGHLNIGMKSYLNKDQSTDIEIKYKLDSIDLNDLENKRKFIINAVLVVLALILAAIVGRQIFNKRLIKISSGKKDIIKTLDERKAKIIEFLLQNKNKSVFQSKIFKEFGGSKATLSRDIKKLEMQKKLIKTEAIGNSKKISLTKWFLEK